MWTGWYLGIFGFVLNTDRFAKELKDLKKPASWDDAQSGLEGPPDAARPREDRRWLCLHRHANFRFAAAAMAASPSADQYAAAEDKAMDYMKKLHANIGQYTGTAPQADSTGGARPVHRRAELESRYPDGEKPGTAD